MTQTFITSRTVLVSQSSTPIPCPQCAKIAGLSDGQRTLMDIAQSLHYPLIICEKFVRRALANNWLVIKQPAQDIAEQAEFWETLQSRISSVMGESSQPLLNRAAQMTGGTFGRILASDIQNYLIAVELNADEHLRPALIPHLDDLKRQFVVYG